MKFLNLFGPKADNLPPPYTESQRDGGYANIVFLDDINVRGYRATGSQYNFDHTSSLAVPWHAELEIQAKDIVTLLERGLFWSEENIDRRKNFIVLDDPARFTNEWPGKLGYPHYRCYTMADTSADPDWRGTLCVYTHDPATLHAFRPSDLSLNNIRFSTARNSAHQFIYLYDSSGAIPNFSAVSGDRPLPGWWPWPKEKGSSS